MKPSVWWIGCLSAASLLMSAGPGFGGEVVDTGSVQVEITDGQGITAWSLKNWNEELFKVNLGSETEPVAWSPGGVRLGYVLSTSQPVVGSTSAPAPTVRDGETVLCPLLEGDGRHLPVGLRGALRFEFPGGYLVRVRVTLENPTAGDIDLEDPKRGPVALYVTPLMLSDLALTELVAADESGAVKALSAAKGVVETVGRGHPWIGARSTYYAVGLREDGTAGQYVHAHATVKLRTAKPNPRVPAAGAVYALGWRFGWPKIRPGERLEAAFELYLGPKTEPELSATKFAAIFNTWDGISGPVGRIMFALLKAIYGWTHSYGLAILLLTFLVKLILHPLNRKQMAAMKKMQELQPKIQELKKRIKDQAKQNAEMQRLFIENQVNPLAGCFPILLQIPIFVALYTCLSSALELKGIPFLWMPDLSAPDPIYLLPLLFSVTMYFSQPQPSAGADPSQAQMMKYMPAIMFVMFVSIASGVMLYIAGQSLVSMLEQKFTGSTVGAAGNSGAPTNGTVGS